jgi:hypothetical protein
MWEERKPRCIRQSGSIGDVDPLAAITEVLARYWSATGSA